MRTTINKLYEEKDITMADLKCGELAIILDNGTFNRYTDTIILCVEIDKELVAINLSKPDTPDSHWTDIKKNSLKVRKLTEQEQVYMKMDDSN